MQAEEEVTAQAGRMSALDQARTFRVVRSMSALPPENGHLSMAARCPVFAESRSRLPVADVGSDFEFEADFHDLCARDLEIGARSLGIVMHECEKLFTPARHTRPPAGSDNRLMARVIGHVLQVAFFDFSV